MALDVASSSSEDEVLERMLKEAGCLASKMMVASSRASVHSKSTVEVASQDLLVQSDIVEEFHDRSNHDSVKKDNSLKPQEMRNQAKPQQKDENDIDEVLRQSEVLLGRMRSKTSVSSSGSLTEKGSGAEAPSSVYVLHQSNIHDDVSSVGSSSLRVSLFSSSSDDALKLANARDESPSLAEPLKRFSSESGNVLQSESLTFSATPTPSAPDEVPVMNESGNVLQSESRIVSATPTPSAPDEVPAMNYASVVSEKGMASTLQTEIPDFTETSPDAKWEKVTSARLGDDDYVPIEDYCFEERRNGNELGAARVPTKGSRLAADREQARLKRKRWQIAIIALALVTSGVFFSSIRKGKKSLKNTHEGVSSERLMTDATLLKSKIESPESGDDIGASYPDYNADDPVNIKNVQECRMDHGNGKEPSSCDSSNMGPLQDKVTETAFEETQREETQDSNGTEGKFTDSDMKTCEACDMEATPSDNRHDLKDARVVVDDNGIDLVTDTPGQKSMDGSCIFSKEANIDDEISESRGSNIGEATTNIDLLPRSCRNLLARIFVKKCRILARQRKKHLRIARSHVN